MEFPLVFVVCLITTAAAQTTQSNPGCGNTSYYGPFGVISSPNHPGNYYDNLYCDYDVYAPTGSSLSFFFKSFNSEEGVDLVTISSPTNSSFSPQEYSGNVLPNPVSIPWCSQGRVNFRTDKSIVYSGFSLDYYVSTGGCGNTVYNESTEYVSSPNWPEYYANNLDCYNIIWAVQRSTFSLYFSTLFLYGADFLEISCLDNSQYGPYRYYQYHTLDNLDIYECNQVLLWFHTEASGGYIGFNIRYSIYPDAGCGNTSYYGPSGVISSPNYPGNYYNDLYCYNRVYASEGSSLSFIFKSFNTQAYTDYVYISCATNESFPQRSFSGNSLPDPFSIPWCSQGWVRFKTSSSSVYTGFSLDYFVSVGGCGNTVFNNSFGYVTSPGYPSDYGYNQNCSNIIWTPQRSTFYFIFQNFNLHNCCDCDWLEINCMDNLEYGPWRYCGTRDDTSLHIYGCSQVLLWFHSDGSDNYRGFNIQYNVIPDAGSTVSTTTTTASTTFFVPPNSTVSTSTTTTSTTFFVPPNSTVSTSTTTASTTFFVPPSSTASTSTTTATTTAIVPQDCGETSYYGPSGVISSPNYPGNYANDLSCDYYVNASASSSSIAIIFEALDTEECCDYLTISCPTNPIYPSWRYSGSTLPQPLSIPWCSGAVVNFITDSSTVSTGFSLDYHISLGGCGDTVYTEAIGYVSSPNYPSDYDNNHFCSNIIWTRLRSSFSITFLYMKVEECCDFVELSCLDNAGYGTHRFTGTTIPPKQTIPQCTQVRVWFSSDDSVVDEGFSLEYTATPESDGQK